MNTGKVFYGAVLGMIVGMSGSSCKGAERNSTPDKDTSVLARSAESFTINSAQPFYQGKLESSGKKLSPDKKTVLMLDQPKVDQTPDGVYEVYLTAEKSDTKTLSASHPGFVNVLDLYSLTTEAPPDYISVDLTKILIGLSKSGQALTPLYVTVLFKGNVMPDNSMASTQAGKLSIKSIRVVQAE